MYLRWLVKQLHLRVTSSTYPPIVVAVLKPALAVAHDNAYDNRTQGYNICIIYKMENNVIVLFIPPSTW